MADMRRGNPCCEHRQCRPDPHDQSHAPHWCAEIPAAYCRAHISGLGCVRQPPAPEPAPDSRAEAEADRKARDRMAAWLWNRFLGRPDRVYPDDELPVWTPPKGCADFPGPEGCCDSCHDDEAAGYEELITTVLPDGGTARVCCARLRNMDDATGGSE